MSSAAETGSLNRAVNVKDMRLVHCPHKVRDCKDSIELSTKVRGRRLEYIITSSGLSGQHVLVREWRRAKRRRLIANWESGDHLRELQL